VRKAIDTVRGISNKIHLSLFTASLGRLSPHLFPAFDHFGSFYCKKQIGVSFLRVCPLIDDKIRHNISKATAEPVA